MKVKIFQSGKLLNLTSDINEFLETRPQIANVLQTQAPGLITITFFYREAATAQAAQPGAARPAAPATAPAAAPRPAPAPPVRPSTEEIELPD
jgi:hypothetical protein